MLLSVRSHFVALLVDRPLIGLALLRTLLPRSTAEWAQRSHYILRMALIALPETSVSSTA